MINKKVLAAELEIPPAHISAPAVAGGRSACESEVGSRAGAAARSGRRAIPWASRARGHPARPAARMERRVFERSFCHLSTYRLIWFVAAVMLCRAQVLTQDEREELHKPVSLRCFLETSKEVLIVTWQKMKASSPDNMVTFSKDHGVVLQPAYKDKMNITELGLKNTTITFWNTTLDDEGCYTCLFNTFGSGKISGVACLTVFVQPKVFVRYNLSEDHLNVTCSANARPAPMISWKVSISGMDNSTEVIPHPNGTTTVISSLHIKDPKSQMGKEVICQVLHMGTVTDYGQTVNKAKLLPPGLMDTGGFWFSVPLLLSIVSLVILLILISILLYWKRHRTQDRARLHSEGRCTELQALSHCAIPEP